MFNKQSTNQRPPGTDTLLGQSSRFEGTLHCETNLHIEGQIVGDIICSQHVIIGDTGSVTSSVQASNLTIAGQLNGKIKVTGSCIIESTGILTGDVESNIFIIREGGTFNGTSTMEPKSSSGKVAEEKVTTES